MRYPLAAVAVVLTISSGTARVCQAQITATERAQKGVTSALNELADAELTLKVAKARVDRSVQSTPEWSEAEKARTDAEAQLGAVSKAAAQSLQNNPAYKAAVEKKQEAEQKRDALKVDPSSTPEQRTLAAIEVLAAASVVTKLEREAISADPAVAQAKIALAAANAKLAALRKALEDKYKDDKDVQAAKKRLEDDKTALASVKKELAFRQSEDIAARNAPPPPQKSFMEHTLPPTGVITDIPGNHTAK